MYRGTCNSMCPDKERYERSALRSQLSMFEPNEWSMVKEYRRAGADQEEPSPEDLRTPKALEITMDHLTSNIMNDNRSKTTESALDWYDFLWDRLRAIRKDITQQNICDPASVRLVERCTRFHVHSCYVMKNVKDFDEDMNKRNLNDCLQMLRQMYTDLKIVGITCPGELEFQIYDLLLHFDEDHSYTNMILRTSSYRDTDEMKYITKLYNAYMNNNYYEFFKLMEKADYMSSCILSLYVSKMRLTGLKRMIVASTTVKSTVWFPSSIVIDTLKLDDARDLLEFAISLGIDIRDNNLQLNRDLLNSIRQSGALTVTSKRLVENKMQDFQVGQLVYGKQVDDVIPVQIMPMEVEPVPVSWPIRKAQYDIGNLASDNTVITKPPTISNNIKPPSVVAYQTQVSKPIIDYKFRFVKQNQPVQARTDHPARPDQKPQVIVTDITPQAVVRLKTPEEVGLINQPCTDVVETNHPPMIEAETPVQPESPNDPDGELDIDDDEPQKDQVELRNKVADLMPAGRFRVITRIPTLKRPPEEVRMVIPPKQVCPARQSVTELKEKILYEAEANTQIQGVMNFTEYMSYINT